KKTAFGITGAAAATLLVGGLTAPAMAAPQHSMSHGDSTSTSTELSQFDLLESVDLNNDLLGDISGGDVSNESPVVVAPEVGVGDIGSGNAIGSGNETAIGNDIGNGNDVGANVSDVVDSTTGVTSSVSDIVDSVDVDGMVSDITDDLDLGGILGD